MENIGILIIDDDVASQAALRQVLGAEGWFVEATGSPSQAFQELATGKWSLVLANVETTGVIGALFTTLRELALAPLRPTAPARRTCAFCSWCRNRPRLKPSRCSNRRICLTCRSPEL